MQKKIIVMAIASAISTSAFADASFYGIVDAAIANASASGQKSDMVTLSGGQSASRVGLNASEELSGGMKAIVNLEYQLDTQTSQNNTVVTATSSTANTANAAALPSTASSIIARQQLLGLTGSFGTVATGYLQTTGYDWEGKYDPIFSSAVSVLQSMNKGFLIGSIAAAARAQRALAYISPDMNGLTFALNYSTSMPGNGNLSGLGNLLLADAAANVKGTALLASGNYTSGPVSAGLVIANLIQASGTNVSDWALGGSFDAGAAKLYGTYQTSKTTTAAGASATDKALSMTVVLPIGADAAAVQYAKNSPDSAKGSVGGSGFTVGYLHTMSKTTNMYVAYESVKNDSGTTAFSADNNVLSLGWGAAGAANANNGASSSLIAVGLRKKF